MNPMTVEQAMHEALQLARLAVQHEDVPVGAVVIDENNLIIGRGKNERELHQSPEAHAEVLAIRDAAHARGNWNLSGCQLVVTLEPCVMCTGLITLSRIAHVHFGATDIKGGAVISGYAIGVNNKTNHHFHHSSGILESECAGLLKDFFKNLRR